MPICEHCLLAASGEDWGPVPVCSECDNGPISVYNSKRPIETQSVVKHKKPGAKAGDFDYWCPGSKRPPRLQTGHDFCDGCPCQHRPPGSWNQKEQS